jgi:hypothetical protein
MAKVCSLSSDALVRQLLHPLCKERKAKVHRWSQGQVWFFPPPTQCCTKPTHSTLQQETHRKLHRHIEVSQALVTQRIG